MPINWRGRGKYIKKAIVIDIIINTIIDIHLIFIARNPLLILSNNDEAYVEVYQGQLIQLKKY